MKRIINKNIKRLVFPKYDLSIEPDEIKEVDDIIAIDLLGNHFMKEILPKSVEPKVIEELKQKGRKNKIIN